MMGGMAGPSNPMLTPQEQAADQQRRRMAIAGTLLQASGPRPQGTSSPLGAFGEAMQAGAQAGDQFTDQALKMRMFAAQMAQAQQGTQDPSDIRAMQSLGFPLTQEGFAAYNAAKGSPAGAATDALLAQLMVDQRRDQIERDRQGDTQRAEEQRVRREQTGSTLRRGLEQTGELVSLTEKLQGSFLEAGLPASSWRRVGAGGLSGIGAALGMDTGKLDQDLVNFDRLKKGLSDQLISLMSTGDLGQGTNQKLQQFQNALATTETSPGAIMAIQANIAQTLLDEADAQKIEVPGRAAIEANIKKWHEYEAQPVGEPVVDVPAAINDVRNFSNLSIEQIRQMDIGKLTQEQRDALAKRLDALGL
jgi:hypothetical protein